MRSIYVTLGLLGFVIHQSQAELRSVLFEYPASATNITFRVYWSLDGDAPKQQWLTLTNFTNKKNIIGGANGLKIYKVTFNLTRPGTNYLRATASDESGESDFSIPAHFLISEPPPLPFKPIPPMNFRREGSLFGKGKAQYV